MPRERVPTVNHKGAGWAVGYFLCATCILLSCTYVHPYPPRDVLAFLCANSALMANDVPSETPAVHNIAAIRAEYEIIRLRCVNRIYEVQKMCSFRCSMFTPFYPRPPHALPPHALLTTTTGRPSQRHVLLTTMTATIPLFLTTTTATIALSDVMLLLTTTTSLQSLVGQVGC